MAEEDEGGVELQLAEPEDDKQTDSDVIDLEPEDEQKEKEHGDKEETQELPKDDDQGITVKDEDKEKEEKEREKEREKEAEKEREKQLEEERRKKAEEEEQERERQRKLAEEQEKERQRKLEEEQEKERQKKAEEEQEQEKERQRKAEEEKKLEEERQRKLKEEEEKEQQRKKEEEEEKERQRKLEEEKKLEEERQRKLEEEQEKERQRKLEEEQGKEKQRKLEEEQEKERQKKLEEEKEKERQRKLEEEKEKERQKKLEEEKEKERQQKLEEEKEKEKQRKLEEERQNERQRELEEERKKERERLLEEEKEKERRLEEEREKERQRQLEEERERGKRAAESGPPLPNDVRVVSSDMSDNMEQCAVQLAVDAVQQFREDKMGIAKHVMTSFEERYGAPWHCIASDNDLGFFSRYETHLYFVVGDTKFLIFKNEYVNPSQIRDSTGAVPDPEILAKAASCKNLRVVASVLKPERLNYAVGLAVDAIEKSPKNEMRIAQRINYGMESTYGAPFHSVASNGHLGFCVRYDPADYAYFAIDDVSIFVFRHQTVGVETGSPLEERSPWNEQQPHEAHIIASGMNDDAQRFAVNIVREGLKQRFAQEKMEIARLLATRFDEKYGRTFHSALGGRQELGFCAHYDPVNHVYFALQDLTVFLFRQDPRSFPFSAQRRYVPTGVVPSSEIRVSSCGLNDEMRRCVIELTAEAIQKYPNDKMRIADHIVRQFEDCYGGPYNCFVGDTQLGFHARYSPNGHFYFAVGDLSIFFFKQ